MWEMARNAIVLFFRGRLFREIDKVFAWLGVGILATAGILVVAYGLLSLVLTSEVACLSAAAIAGFLGGALQPYLFRDLKYQ
jgi:hypothetical protein